MCCCSLGIIIMKCALSLFVLFVSPFFHPPPVFISLPPLFQLFFFYPFLFLSCPIIVWTTFFINPTCLTLFFLLSSPPFFSFSLCLFSYLQRCRCHQCFVCRRSESCQFRSGTSTRRDLSWLPCTRSFTPVGLAMRTSSASSTGPCWSARPTGIRTHLFLPHHHQLR